VNRAWSAVLRVVCGLFAVAWAALSLGPLANGSFATGDLTGWHTLGSASVVGAQGNIVPPVGGHQAQIGSGSDDAPPPPGGAGGAAVRALGFAKPGPGHWSARGAQSKSATPASRPGNPGPNDPNFADVPVATLETTLNLPAGAIQAALPNNYAPSNGSAIYQTFAGTAGTALTFNWNFATNEKIPTRYDAALYSLQVGSNPAQVFELADTTQASLLSLAAGASSPFITMTGYKTTTVILPSTGTYTIGFISMQTLDDTLASATYINNVQVGASPSNGPVPAAWSLGLLGLGFIAIYSGMRRLRRAI
jgi:hypothetical protein